MFLGYNVLIIGLFVGISQEQMYVFNLIAAMEVLIRLR